MKNSELSIMSYEEQIHLCAYVPLIINYIHCLEYPYCIFERTTVVYFNMINKHGIEKVN